MLTQSIVVTPSGFVYIHVLDCAINVEFVGHASVHVTHLNSSTDYGVDAGRLRPHAIAATADGSMVALLLSRSPAFFKVHDKMANVASPRVAIISVRQAEVKELIQWPYQELEPCGIILDEGSKFFITGLDSNGRCIRVRLDVNRKSLELLDSISWGSTEIMFQNPHLVRIEDEIHVVDMYAQLVMPFIGVNVSPRHLNAPIGSIGGPIDADRFAIMIRTAQRVELHEILRNARLRLMTTWKNSEVTQFSSVAVRKGLLFAIDSFGGIWKEEGTFKILVDEAASR